MNEKRKKVLVVGFFDMFHSGHVEFFRKASEFGELHVSVATDENSIINKNKKPIYTEKERKFMVESCKYVKKAYISYGRSDILSFEPHLILIKPDIFIINEDGHHEQKQKICESLGIEYKVLKRTPHINLPIRSTSNLREINSIPLRLDFVSFFDQKILNKITSGKVVVANIDNVLTDDRSGMSSSTIKTIKKLFGNKLPSNIKKEELAKIIFTIENINNKKYISGAVDQIGICYKGITIMNFCKSYWPNQIKSFIDNNQSIDWLNKYLYIVQTKPRPNNFKLFSGNEKISINLLKKQNSLTDFCLNTIRDKDIINFGKCINEVHENQKKIFPNYESEYCKPIIEYYQKNHYGCKLMGAGGYGYIMVVSDKPEKNFIKVNITKNDNL